MTLQEWSKLSRILPTHPTTELGAVSLLMRRDENPSLYADLWHLDDFKVSTVSGPVIWLVPITR